MAIYRAQCAAWYDSLSPKDAMIINPCFRVDVSPNPQQICDDLADALAINIQAPVQSRVRIYDAEGAKPNFMLAEKYKITNALFPSSTCRELAVCLSFYSQHNVARHRGRLYIPLMWTGPGSTVPTRPSSATRDAIGSYAAIFKNLGGVDTDWVVYSTRDHQAHSVTDWWVDDEWDIQRSRGLAPTTRLKGTTSESGPFRVALQAPASVEEE